MYRVIIILIHFYTQITELKRRGERGVGREMKMKKEEQFEDDKFIASPLMCSFETTPDRTRTTASSFDVDVTEEHLSSCHTTTTTSHYSSSSDIDTSSPTFKTNKEDPIPSSSTGQTKKKFGRKTHSYAYRIREHVRMGPKLSETVKGKLSLGAKIIQQGGRENIFRQVFGMSSGTEGGEGGEKLLKASQCYLSTTAGPIAGILFISTLKVAFCSERSIPIPSPSGRDFVRTPYKVSIPIKNIKRANESENVNKPAQKYIEIVTDDNFEFWFMGFVRYEKAFINLQKAISMSS